MYSNMCLKASLCVVMALCVNSHVINSKTVPLSPEGVAIEVAVKNIRGSTPPLSSMRINIDEQHKQVILSTIEETVPVKNIRVPKETKNPPKEVLPEIGNRNNIRVGSCPTGYTRQGGFCFPNDY